MPDYYASKDTCDKAERVYENTNPRYRNFCQKYFTAGDEEQFQTSRDWSNGQAKADEGIYQTEFSFDIWSGHSELTGDVVFNTFSYIFHKFKKGIYIRIKDNKLVTFLPFSKAKFVNDWGDRIQIHPKYKNIVEFMRYINELEGRHFNEKRVNKFTDEWYANNCLVRYEFPLSEGDTGTSHMKNMFEELCTNRQVPDLEFFVNRRDFPLLKKDGTEPYNHMFDSDSFPLLSHKYDKHCPILSSVTCRNFSDIAIPTIDDWARVKSYEGAFFEKTQNRQYKKDFDTPWNAKKPIAVFRGGSTGVGTTVETNPRLKVAHMSSLGEVDPFDDLPFLDAGITDWNLRPRKIQGERYLQTIDVKSLTFALIPKLTPEQQSEYKYIVHIQGHVSAFRLSLELSMGSTILLVESDYSLWFMQLLKPFVHYVPVKRDLSDLIEKIKWCKKNDDKCREIAKNALLFFKKYLQKDGIFNYLQHLLYETKKCVGTYLYPEKSPLSIQLQREVDWVVRNCKVDLTVEKTLIVKTKNTEVFEAGDYVFKKSVKQSVNEILRDVFIFQNGLRGLENFCEVVGVDGEYVVYKKCSGKTLFEWLKTEFDYNKFINILLQLCDALQKAQDKCGFVHNDLFPWNVMISDKGTPTIIDYGKSHIVHNNAHHGLVNPYAMCSIHDVLCIVFSSIATVVKETHLNRRDEDALVNLVNFFAHSRVLPQKLSSFPKMRHFIYTHSSFSTLCSLDKFGLDMTPKDLVDYLTQSKNYVKPPPTRKTRKALPKLKFKNNILVYYFFQSLNDPKFEEDFKRHLLESQEVDIHIKSLDNEIFLNEKRLHACRKEIKDISQDDFVEMIPIVTAVLSYRGVFQVSERERIAMREFTPFKLLQLKANLNTDLTIINA
jgi:hypothetical protein